MKFIAIDFEGSSKDPRRGAPIQIGAVLMDDDEVIGTFESLIGLPRHYKTGKITREVDAIALAVSGITLEQLESAPSSSTVINDFETKFGDYSHLPMVAFNASYDLECFNNLYFEAGSFDFDAREYFGRQPVGFSNWICARMFAQSTLNYCANFSLDEVVTFLNLPPREGDQHGALEDAILAGKVYAKLQEIKNGVPA